MLVTNELDALKSALQAHIDVATPGTLRDLARNLIEEILFTALQTDAEADSGIEFSDLLVKFKEALAEAVESFETEPEDEEEVGHDLENSNSVRIVPYFILVSKIEELIKEKGIEFDCIVRLSELSIEQRDMLRYLILELCGNSLQLVNQRAIVCNALTTCFPAIGKKSAKSFCAWFADTLARKMV